MSSDPKGASENKSSKRPAFSLVLPLYNEGRAICDVIPGLVAEFEHEGIPCELVLVNNGSNDDTPDILEEVQRQYQSVRVVHVPINEGYGWGIICGLRKARAPVVGFMCGDGQIAPRDVTRVYRQLVEKKLDLCKVVRVERHDGWKRLLLTKCYNLFFRFLFPVKSRDINGTPKLMRRECYRQLDLVSKDWFIDAEIMIKSTEKSYRVGEVEVSFMPRASGDSNVHLTTSFEFVRNMLRRRFLWK